MPYTDRQIEVLAKSHWEAENDVVESRFSTIEAALGCPIIRYAWRDSRLPELMWETRMEIMRFAITEMELECAASSHLPR